MKCITCSNPLTGLQRKFCSVKCKHKNTNNKHQNYEAQQARGERNKLTLMEMKGSKCQNCGYDKNYAALCFHHLRDKKFGITIRECSNNKFSTLLEEAEKCILLCHNCHMELHHPHAIIKNNL